MEKSKRSNLAAKASFSLILTGAVAGISGCQQPQPSPDQVRQQATQDVQQARQNASTAAKKAGEALDQARQDAQGAIAGAKEGWAAGSKKNTVDVNSASEEQLEALPGVNAAISHKIIFGRPYASVDDLRTRGIVTSAEMDKLRGHVSADSLSR